MPIAEAIMQSRASGVRVRVILERDYLTVTRAAADPWQPGGENEANRYIHGALLRARVQVITDSNPNIFHQKFVVSDAATRRAAVLTGSTNFTPTGTAENLNHIVIIRGKRTARVYSKEFAELWSGHVRAEVGSGTTRARAPTGSRGCASKCSSHRTTRRRWRS